MQPYGKHYIYASHFISLINVYGLRNMSSGVVQFWGEGLELPERCKISIAVFGLLEYHVFRNVMVIGL